MEILFVLHCVLACLVLSFSNSLGNLTIIHSYVRQDLLEPEAHHAVQMLLPDYVKGDLSALCVWPDQVRHWYRYRWTSPLHFIDTPDRACNFKYQSKLIWLSSLLGCGVFAFKVIMDKREIRKGGEGGKILSHQHPYDKIIMNWSEKEGKCDAWKIFHPDPEKYLSWKSCEARKRRGTIFQYSTIFHLREHTLIVLLVVMVSDIDGWT